MLLFAVKMKAIKDYEHELNYILFQYRSRTKRKAIKPFTILMRGVKCNKQQINPQSPQNESLITPLTFLEKYLENGQNADRFYNQQQTECADSSPIKKFNDDVFFDQQLSEIANKFGLFQVEQQQNVENTASQQKQESWQSSNDNKILLKLSQNDNRVTSENLYKQQLKEFKYFMKRAINEQNLKLNLDIHARNLSEQKQKELNQNTGALSDLMSDSSKQNTTQSERKLKNNDSSPQSKQSNDIAQKIGARQIFFHKNIFKQESIDLLKENTCKNSGRQQQTDWNKATKHEHDQENECQISSIAHQRDNEDKYLQTIKQSQNEFYQTEFKIDGFSSKRSSKKTRAINNMKNIIKINKFMNQDIRTEQNQTQFYQQNQSHTKQSVDQYQQMENNQWNRMNRLSDRSKQQQISVDTFLKNNEEIELLKINSKSNHFFPTHHKTNSNIIAYARTQRPYQPLFVNHKKFNNINDQSETPVIEQLQINKTKSNSPNNLKVQSKKSQDYFNHFNPKRALSRMKQQQRGVSQFKSQNVCKHEKQYHSVSRSKRIQGAIQGVKKRWQKNALRFKTKIYNS